MPRFKPEDKNLSPPLLEAFAAATGMGLFALFAHSGFPLVLLAGTGLLATTLAIIHSYRSERRLPKILGFTEFTKATAAYLILGCALGALLGISYRVNSNMGILPAGLGSFVFAAAIIGAAEEVLYRGFIQGRLQGLGRMVAPVLAAVAHTAYKLALFALPPEGIVIDYSFLALGTFGAGVIVGILREISGSVLPPIGGHVMFDIIVYGENISAPWWVWS